MASPRLIQRVKIKKRLSGFLFLFYLSKLFIHVTYPGNRIDIILLHDVPFNNRLICARQSYSFRELPTCVKALIARTFEDMKVYNYFKL